MIWGKTNAIINMMRKYNGLLRSLTSQEVGIALLVLLACLLLLVLLTLSFTPLGATGSEQASLGLYSDRHFWEEVLVECHGMILDLLILGVLIFWLQSRARNRQEKEERIRRYHEELDDFRGWDHHEAMYRNLGIIKRLNREGIHQMDLSRSYLRGAKMQQEFPVRDILWDAGQQYDTELRKVDLRGSFLYKADLQESNLNGISLEGGVLSSANLNRASLRKTNLQQARLRGASLIEAQLQGANLRKADFRGAILLGADLQQADLRDANFQGANLRGAKLQNVKLSKLSLTAGEKGKRLVNVNFQDADLTDARALKSQRNDFLLAGVSPEMLEKMEWISSESHDLTT